MNDTIVTVIGNVVADPRHVVTSNGTHLASLRLASTSRRFDRGLGKWRDANTLFVDVSCWRSLADNVAASVEKGDPLIVRGRLRMRSFTTSAGENRVVPEIDARAVGHDLSRGVTRFRKLSRLASAHGGVPAEGVTWTGETATEGEEATSVPEDAAPGAAEGAIEETEHTSSRLSGPASAARRDESGEEQDFTAAEAEGPSSPTERLPAA